MSAPRPRPNHLRAVPTAPADPHRIQGGQVEDHWAERRPWARLPEASYWIRPDGWVIRPFRYVAREPLKGATESERDFRLILHCAVLGVDDADPNAPAARSALFQHGLASSGRPKIPHGFRVAVGKTSGRWRVPSGETLWGLLDATGHRTDTLTAEHADALLGWLLLVRIHTPTRRAARKPGRPGSRIPEPARYSWGAEVEDVRPPTEPKP